jgi:hypothetical protein
MNFEQEIKPIIDYLCENEFAISEQHSDFVQLESDTGCFVLSKDPREQGISIYVGQKGFIPDQLTAEIYKNVFQEDFSNSLPFPDNFIQFLKGNGHSLVKGDQTILNHIERLSSEASKTYTEEILQNQQLNKLEELWQNKEYETFIAIMNRTDTKILPAFYKLRYNIAKKRVK